VRGNASATEVVAGEEMQEGEVGTRAVQRIAVQSLGYPPWRLEPDDLEAATWKILRCVWNIKSAVRDSRTAAVLGIPAGT
jgi:hypothetical protein